MMRTLLYAVPLVLASADALAWGLQTHVYFAQALLWLVPLADRRLTRAARRFPRLLLAGACLPDLALMAREARTPQLCATHGWAVASRLLHGARDDGERAAALGYASHLVADVLAHNHYVPAHETMWVNLPVLTHAFCEWAMDARIAGQLFATPGELLASEAGWLAPYVARNFACSVEDAAANLRRLCRAERVLRASRLPQALFAGARLADRGIEQRLHHYLDHTLRSLRQIDRLAAGCTPLLQAETCRHLARAGLAHLPRWQLAGALPLPDELFLGPAPIAQIKSPA